MDRNDHLSIASSRQLTLHSIHGPLRAQETCRHFPRRETQGGRRLPASQTSHHQGARAGDRRQSSRRGKLAGLLS